METDGLFQSVGTKDRLVDRVVNNIQQLIVDGQLAPGTRLPPERDFAERMGVSRTVVREAVRILVARGLLETYHGVGTVVRQMSTEQILEPLNLLLQTSGLTFDHIHQVRSILEVGIVRVAALQATEEDLAALERLVNGMEEHLEDVEICIALDDDFHQALARTTHNPLLMILAQSIGTIMHEVRLHVHSYTVIHGTAIPDHRRILERVRARDPEGAAQTMLVHLEHARRFQMEYLAQQEALHAAPALG